MTAAVSTAPFERKDPRSKQSGQTRTYVLRPPLVLRQTELPSVTSILGALPKPALQLWGQNLVARAAVDDRHMLLKMEPEAMYDYLRKVPEKQMKSRGRRGSSIHEVAENVLKGTHPEENRSPWAARIRAFVDEWVAEVIAVEQVVVSLRHGWAGTTDFIFRNAQGDVVLADWKTSASIYPDQAMQLAAYCRADAWVMNPYTSPSLVEPLHIDRIAVLHVTNDGVTYYEPDYDIDKLYSIFLSVQQTWLALRNSPTKIKMTVMPHPPRPTVAEEVANLRARCVHAQSEHSGFRAILAARWPEDMPGLASGEIHNIRQCAVIDKVIMSVERDLGITFGAVPYPHLGYGS